MSTRSLSLMRLTTDVTATPNRRAERACMCMNTENVGKPRRLQADVDISGSWNDWDGTWRSDPVRQQRRQRQLERRRRLSSSVEDRLMQFSSGNGGSWNDWDGAWWADPVQQRRSRRIGSAVRRRPDRTADRHRVTASSGHSTHEDTGQCHRRRRNTPTQGDQFLAVSSAKFYIRNQTPAVVDLFIQAPPSLPYSADTIMQLGQPHPDLLAGAV